MHKPIAITMGDPGGIGPEIVLKCYLKSQDRPEFHKLMQGTFIVGDILHLERAKRSLGDQGASRLCLKQISNIQDAQLEEFSKHSANGCVNVPVLSVNTQTHIETQIAQDKTDSQNENALAPIAQVSAQAGQIAAANILWGARAALRGEVGALVTAPINKQSLNSAGITFPGHTEMLQFAAAEHLGVSVDQVPVRMMLVNSELRVVLVSIHLSLRAAIEQVTQDNIIQTVKITHSSLLKLLGRSPRIAVAGLNPHSGEGGLMGAEELEIIAPALERAQTMQGEMNLSGPFAPDTVFMQAREGAFDVVIAMYHDQGLIPIKYMGLDQGVNVTLGLPMIRTSPDHGTAYEIAGQGIADPASMWASVELARALVG